MNATLGSKVYGTLKMMKTGTSQVVEGHTVIRFGTVGYGIDMHGKKTYTAWDVVHLIERENGIN